MRLRRDHLVMRGLGVLMGLGFVTLGVYALTGGPAGPAGSRALGLGLSLLVVGALAVVGSLLVADPHGIW